jgi:hypothetical protein
MATTTPNYGWPVPTDTDYVKDGAAAIEALGDAIDATVFGLGSGLNLIKTQTIGTAVSSVTVTDAFSADYDAYKIIVSGGTGANNAALNLQLGASTTGYNTGLWYVTFSTGTFATASNNNAANFKYVGGTSTSTLAANIDLINPFLAKHTRYQNGTYAFNNSGGYAVGQHTVETSYTAFTLIPESPTITGGLIAVYGYEK